MGWLGYFVSKNEHLQELIIKPFTSMSGADYVDVIEPFFRGVNNNKSIREISFVNVILLGGEMFTMLTPFFQNNYNLTNIVINECDFGDEGCRLFALALGSSTNKSLRSVTLENLLQENDIIAEEGMVDIITALSVHHHLQSLDLEGNRLSKNGCVALATLLRCSAKELQCLFISNNEINDGGIEALVPVLATCSHLKELHLCNNPFITTRGWQSLATILEAPNSNLGVLYLVNNNIDDEAVATFAKALTTNNKLHKIFLDNIPTITAVGWQESFSKVLCDASSVNSTFLSNHTIHYLGDEVDVVGTEVTTLLDLNCREDKKEVAMIKILLYHEDFDMQPFFEWEFKVLPLIINWLDRASKCKMPARESLQINIGTIDQYFEPNIEERKLSTIYQFVRGMPVLYVETRLRKELEEIKSEESQMVEKLEEEQRKLQQKFEQRKRYLQERKASIMKNLGVGGNLQI